MGTWVNTAVFLLSAAILIPAAIIDIREHRIPNGLCLAGFILAALLHGVLSGWGGFGLAIAAGLLLLVMNFPFFVLGWLGAGDVKLIAVAGAIAGSPQNALWVLLGIVTAGVFMAIISTAHPGAFQGLLQRITTSVPFPAQWRPRAYVQAQQEPVSQPFPYALAIAAGAILVLATRALLAIR